MLIVSDKAPFDLVEAESEIIDGITLDTGSILFSLIYSAETYGFLVLCFLFIFYSKLLTVIFYSVITLTVCFMGRLFLPRILIMDLLNFICNLLLFLVVFVIHIYPTLYLDNFYGFDPPPS